MSELNAAQNPTFYRVRIRDGHNAIGLLVSAAGKRCIPSTQFWLTVDACAAYRFPHNAALCVQVRLGKPDRVRPSPGQVLLEPSRPAPYTGEDRSQTEAAPCG